MASGSAATAAAIRVRSVAVVDGAAVLTLTRGVGTTETISVSYLPAAMHPLRDASFNPAPALTGWPVRIVEAAEPGDVAAWAGAPADGAPVPVPTSVWKPAKVEVLDLSGAGSTTCPRCRD